MFTKRNFIQLIALLVASIGVATTSGAQAADVLAAADVGVVNPATGLQFSNTGRRFQLAFVTRIASDRVVGDGSEELVLGVAESLQSPVAGRIIGHFEERILYNDPVTDFAPEGYPEGSFIAKIVDTVSTRAGDLTYEAVVAGVPGAPLEILTTSLSGKILGGTGRFSNAQGTVTLAGKITHCDLTLGEPGCAESDFVPYPEGLRFDCHFILRGTW